MIRSFHYAARTALDATAEQSTINNAMISWSRAWHEWMSAVFVGAYFETAAGAPFLPAADADLILDIFLLEKAFYELKYELNNRPDWIHIPLSDIVDIIGKKKTSKGEK